MSLVSADPRLEYSRRLQSRRATEMQLRSRESLVGNCRIAVFLAGAGVAWLAFGAAIMQPAWLVVPLVAFVALVMWHERVKSALARASRGVSLYEAALDRLDDRWSGRGGETGARFLNSDHPYAADLDLFGTGSLYERLCRARTQNGEATLAEWLMSPASPNEIIARQEALAELRLRLDLREELDLLGGDASAIVNPEGLAAWGASQPVLDVKWARVAALTLSGLVFLTLGGWLILDWPRSIFLAVLIVQIGFTTWLRPRVERVLGLIDRKVADLVLLAMIVARMEREPMAAARLLRLRAALESDGVVPSVRIAQLGRIVSRLDWRYNQLFAPVALMLMWATHHAFALEAWRVAWGPKIVHWLGAVGDFEALCALAGYSYENPTDVFPEIVPEGALFDGTGVGHPLIPISRLVRNDVHLGGDLRVMVVSGSNMSGKSTLLRTVGTNAVLALAGAPVRARSLRVSPLAVGATLRIQDSLQAGRSRFFAEITRVRQLVELANCTMPLLFLLDELFQGTNSHDRRLGAEAVVRSLVDRGAIGMVTTHDLALTHIAERLAPRAANVHFEDNFENGIIGFDYHMRPGVVQKSNALALMRAVGLDVPSDGNSQILGKTPVPRSAQDLE